MTYKSGRRGRNSSKGARTIELMMVGGTGLGLAWGAKAGTTITFEGFTENNISIASIPGYGDNVSANSADYSVSANAQGIVGTPDIVLDWLLSGKLDESGVEFGAQWDSYTGWDGRGSVAQSDFSGGPYLSLQFRPSANLAVSLESFDLDEYAGGGDGSITWSVVGPTSGTLATGNWTMTTAGGRSVVVPGAIGGLGEALTLNLQLDSGAGTYFALDNLTFSQVPEPSVMGLGALGAVIALGARAMRRGPRA